MVLWETSSPSSLSAGFLNKVSVPCPISSSLNLSACRAASSTSLELATDRHSYSPHSHTVTPRQSDFAAPLVRRWNLFLCPFNLGWPYLGWLYSLLWLTECGRNDNVPVLSSGLRKPCMLCSFSWTFAFTLRISPDLPALGQETKWNKVKSSKLRPSRQASS